MNSLLARLLMVVAVALAPVVAFQAYTETEARHVRQQLMEEEVLRLVHLVSFEQQRIIEGAEQVLDVISSAPSVQDNVPAFCQRLLGNLMVQSPRYASASVVGLDGRIVCSPNPASIGRDMSDRSYFQDALRTGGLAVGEYAIGRSSGKPTMVIAKPFKNRDGVTAGVVEVALSLAWFGEQLTNLSLPPGGSARIADRNGIILARHADNARYIGQSILAENRFTLEGNEIVVRSAHGFDGRTFLIAYAPPGAVPNGLAVLVGLDPEITFAAITRANRVGLWLIIASCALALSLTALVGHRLIRRPVAQLLRAAANWRTGALAVRTRLRKDSSEFGRLGIAFDEMAVALQAREAALRTALESTTDYVMVIDDRWRFTYLNGYAKAYVGDRDVIGQSFWDVFPHLVGSNFDESCRTAMERRLPGKVEVLSAHTHRYFQTNVYPSEGGVTLYARDVTEERRVAAALRASEARLQLAKEAAGFGIWDWDLIADTMVWSEQNWRLYGRTPRIEGPPSRLWHSWLHTADRDRVVAAHEASLSDPDRPLDIEFRVIWPDGTVHWLLRKSTMVRDADGKPIRMVGLNMDVTDSRETEAALRRLSSDLEQRVIEEVAAREAAQARAAQAERMQALGQLAGGIAHDFNNVLQTVSGAIALIERRASDDAAIRRLAKLANEAAERGASITRRLLAFGRRGDLHVETLDVADLLRGLHEVLSHTLGAGITVRMRLGSDLCPITADRRQLETVMVNLATNARDAMPGGGQLILSADVETIQAAGPLHPAALVPGRYVRLTVTDTGAGMDAATLARAREPFFTTKRLGVGTGLGLPMAQGFAEQSGGTLGIESRPGEGTTVTLWLPRAETDVIPRTPALPHADASRVAPGLFPRILLVDDESTIREVLAEILEDAGYQVVVAADGTEALALLDTGPAIAALVTDLSMPGMDGLAVIRAAQERFPSMPAVLLTGYAGDDAALALGTAIAGPVSLLRKPIRGVELLDRLSAMLAVKCEDDEDQTAGITIGAQL
jgi:signal transduction histidine kinase/ActR/RegA family two-component response regulator